MVKETNTSAGEILQGLEQFGKLGLSHVAEAITGINNWIINIDPETAGKSVINDINGKIIDTQDKLTNAILALRKEKTDFSKARQRFEDTKTVLAERKGQLAKTTDEEERKKLETEIVQINSYGNELFRIATKEKADIEKPQLLVSKLELLIKALIKKRTDIEDVLKNAVDTREEAKVDAELADVENTDTTIPESFGVVISAIQKETEGIIARQEVKNTTRNAMKGEHSETADLVDRILKASNQATSNDDILSKTL